MQDAQQHARQGASRDAMHAMHTGHGDVAAGTWATLAEAASILGCSVDTVRRRIRRGELYAVQDAGRHGPTWRVLLSVTPGVLLTPDNTPCSTLGVTPSVDGATPSVAPGSQDSTPGSVPNAGEDSPALLEALRMLDALRRENRDLAA